MTVAELIEQLSTYNPDSEVYILTQPSWPLEFTLSHVTSERQIDEYLGQTRPDHQPKEWQDGDDLGDFGEDGKVYLVEGGNTGYGPKAAWEMR